MKTKINTSICFDGNCEEALKFYERAFGVKAEIAGRYKDNPGENEEERGGMNEDPKFANYIMHAEIKLDEGQELYFCDYPGSPTFNGSMGILLSFDTVEKANDVFAILADGGKIVSPICKTFWSECYGNVIDKFGMDWQITVLESMCKITK